MRRNTSRGPSFFVYCEDNQDERLDLGPVETGARPHHACCWPKGEGGIGGDFFTLAGGGGVLIFVLICVALCGGKLPFCRGAGVEGASACCVC